MAHPLVALVVLVVVVVGVAELVVIGLVVTALVDDLVGWGLFAVILAEFGPQAAFNKSPQRLAQFRSPLLGRDKEVIGKVYGSLHTGKHIPVFMEKQATLPATPIADTILA
jgi:hypothetical protein